MTSEHVVAGDGEFAGAADPLGRAPASGVPVAGSPVVPLGWFAAGVSLGWCEPGGPLGWLGAAGPLGWLGSVVGV
ncbi:hypothetical protein ACI2K4_00575 [Micromonospora sp. NPDC050397]|uniref:hypothetical protein n=1 Tax=Micromonospora sp. NPDC050397 TaxID=3364279 RepID=UPI00384E5B3A